MNRRGFLQTLFSGVVAGPAALEILAKSMPKERQFSYFDGEKQVTVGVKVLLERFRDLAGELVLCSQGGKVEPWLDANYVAYRLREIFKMKPHRWVYQQDSGPRHAWASYSEDTVIASEGPTVEDVLIVTNKFFDGVYEELMAIMKEEKEKTKETDMEAMSMDPWDFGKCKNG